jgi:hypothetical protein
MKMDTYNWILVGKMDNNLILFFECILLISLHKLVKRVVIHGGRMEVLWVTWRCYWCDKEVISGGDEMWK